MRVVVEYTAVHATVERRVVQIVNVAPFQMPAGITVDLGTQAGQILICVGAGLWEVLDAPPANDQTLVSDLTLLKKWKLGASGAAGGGFITLTNKDTGANAAVASVVVAELGYDDAFKGTAIPQDLSVVGVTAEAININASGKVAIAALTDVLVKGNVSRGEWLVTSDTKWRAKSAGFSKPLHGSIGYAMKEYTGGGNGQVMAVVMPDPYHLSAAGTAWALGGVTTVAQTNGQKFTVASATWASVVNAALTTATYTQAGLGYGTTWGYSIGGFTTVAVITAYKMPFATETTATQSSANLPATRYSLGSGFNAADRGYVVGGNNAGARTEVYKLTFATDAMSAALGTALSAAREFPEGVSNGTYAYAQGGTGSGVSDLITVATDTVSDNNSGDVTADEYSAISFAADNGYMAEKSGATSNSKKIGLATGVSANVTSTLPADQFGAASVCDGNGLGWYSGDDASPYSVSHKFTKATETYAADAGAVMAFGKYRAASFNNGAY